MDREKVIGHLNDCMMASRIDNTWVFVRKDIIADALALLKEQEAVVRCKNCKHWTKALGGQCNRLTVNEIAHCTSPDWFCGDGELKD